MPARRFVLQMRHEVQSVLREEARDKQQRRAVLLASQRAELEQLQREAHLAVERECRAARHVRPLCARGARHCLARTDCATQRPAPRPPASLAGGLVCARACPTRPRHVPDPAAAAAACREEETRDEMDLQYAEHERVNIETAFQRQRQRLEDEWAQFVDNMNREYEAECARLGCAAIAHAPAAAAAGSEAPKGWQSSEKQKKLVRASACGSGWLQRRLC